MNIASIQSINAYITNITPYVLLVLGNFGCLCNFLTFTSKQLRRNSCGWYLLMSALFDFCFINFGLFTKVASEQYGSKLQNSNIVWCKIRTYFSWIFPSFATGFLVLASIDRCLSTSPNATFRSFSQLKIAYRMTCIPIILYSLTTCHQFFYFVLQPGCVPLPGIYSYFLSMYSIIWTSLIPQSAILILGFLTYWNVHQSHQRLNQPRTRTDSQLITITLVQVLCSSIFLNIRTAYFSYSVLSTNLTKDSYRQAVEAMLLQISSFIFYFNFSKNFFINTLSSKLFRRVFHERLQLIYHRRIQIHPAAETRLQQTQYTKSLV